MNANHIKPKAYQRIALNVIEKARANGQKRALLQIDPGVGSNLTAAFDIQRFFTEHPEYPQQVLVLCNRKMSFGQALTIFQDYFGEAYSYAMLDMDEDQPRCNFMFASISYLYDFLSVLERDLADGKDFVSEEMWFKWMHDWFGDYEFPYIVEMDANYRPFMEATGKSFFEKLAKLFKPQFLLGLMEEPLSIKIERLSKVYGEPIYTYTMKDLRRDTPGYTNSQDRAEKISQMLGEHYKKFYENRFWAGDLVYSIGGQKSPDTYFPQPQPVPAFITW